MSALRYRTTSLTHEGRQRPRNEDAVLVHPSGRLWAVADGMGGHKDGRFASETAVAELSACRLTGDADADTQAITHALFAANRTIRARADAAGATIGTTVAALYAGDGPLVCFWIGDSRVYRVRGGIARQLTTDHTHLNDLIAAGKIAPGEGRTHPMRHVLTRALGVDGVPRIDTLAVDVELEDIFVLCSDGLTAVVGDDEIGRLAGGGSILRASERLLDLSLERGAPDNVSVIVVLCDEITKVEAAP